MQTEFTHPAAVHAKPPRRGLRRTISTYARLGNMKVYIQWLPPLIGWSLVAHPFGVPAAGAAAIALFMLACMLGTASGGALDDLQGFRDGIDQQTYGRGDARDGFQAKSNTSVKPLVTGELTDRQAHTFGVGVALAGAAVGGAAILLAPHSSWWLIAIWAVWVWLCSQYGYGVKVSYWGGAEALLGTVIAGLICIPVIFLAGRLTPEVGFEAYLIGTLLSQVTLFSMIYDREIDGAAGRRSLAVRFSPPAYRVVVVGWFVTGWVVGAVGLAVGALTPWLLLAWLPVLGMQVAQLRFGLFRDDSLLARQLGWHAFDVAFVGFILVNLLTR